MDILHQVKVRVTPKESEKLQIFASKLGYKWLSLPIPSKTENKTIFFSKNKVIYIGVSNAFSYETKYFKDIMSFKEQEEDNLEPIIL